MYSIFTPLQMLLLKLRNTNLKSCYDPTPVPLFHLASDEIKVCHMGMSYHPIPFDQQSLLALSASTFS